MGYLAALFVVLSLTASIYLFSYAAKQSSVLHILFLETAIGLVLILPLLFFIDKLTLTEIFTKPTKENWCWLGSAAFFGYVGGNYFSLVNIKTAGQKVNALLSPAITATAIIFSFFIFKEKLTGLQWLGILIVLVAVAYFLLQNNSYEKITNKKQGIISGVMTVFCIATTIICSIKGADKNISLLHAIWIRLLIAFIFILLPVLINSKKTTPKNHNLKFYTIVIFTVITQTIIGNYLWFYATSLIGIAVFQVILATLPLCVYATDVFILKKTEGSLLFLIVSLIVTAGICLVVFS